MNMKIRNKNTGTIAFVADDVELSAEWEPVEVKAPRGRKAAAEKE